MLRVPPRLLALGLIIGVGGSAHASERILRDGETLGGTWSGTRDLLISEEGSTHHDPFTNYDGFDNSVDGDPGDNTTLIRWDLTPAGIPSSAVVQSASITLQISNTSVLSYDVFEALTEWSAAEATWQVARAQVPWTTPGAQGIGADRGATVLTTVTGEVGSRTFPLNAAGIAVVQKWLDMPASNFGLVIQDHLYKQWDGLGFRHSQTPDPSERPRLTVVTEAHGTFHFQNGVQPNAAYSGNSDTTIALAPDREGNANRMGLGAGKQPNTFSLISFDLSPIPPGATVTATSLILHATEGATFDVRLFPVLRPWVEAEAGWNTFDGVQPWGAPGAAGTDDLGSLVLAVSGPVGVGPNVFEFNADGIAQVQAWLADPASNHGVALINRDAFPRPRFADRETPEVSLRPALRVTYQTAIVALLDVSSEEVSSDDEPIVVDASASSPTEGSTITAYHWRQLEGPTGFTFSDGARQELTLPEPGRYVIELRVEDGTGAMSAPVSVALTHLGTSDIPSWTRGCAAGGADGGNLLAPLVLLAIRLPRSFRSRARSSC